MPFHSDGLGNSNRRSVQANGDVRGSEVFAAKIQRALTREILGTVAPVRAALSPRCVIRDAVLSVCGGVSPLSGSPCSQSNGSKGFTHRPTRMRAECAV